MQEDNEIGFSVDEPGEPVEGILAFMLVPVMGEQTYIARVIPKFSLKTNILIKNPDNKNNS